MIAVSTSWYSGTGLSVDQWLKLVKDTGFDAIELSYKVTAAELKSFEQYLGKFNLQVSSIHNFCPLPDDGLSSRHPSNYYRLSSIDDQERKGAVKWTKVAIDTAKRVKARAVVLHAGDVDVEDIRTPKLFDLYIKGQSNSDEFKKERERVLKNRDKKRGPFIAALEQSLTEVMPYALKNKIRIGLETRYYPLEIPNFAEVGYFLDRFSDSGLGYWHDVGHAEVHSRLGIVGHKEYLQTYGTKLIGAHIHGIKVLKDHWAPFDGDMDITPYLPFFKSGVIKVVEAKPVATAAQLKAAIARLDR